MKIFIKKIIKIKSYFPKHEEETITEEDTYDESTVTHVIDNTKNPKKDSNFWSYMSILVVLGMCGILALLYM